MAEEVDGLSGSMLGKFYCRISIGKYERPNPFSEASWEGHTNIHLPLPDVLRDETMVKYSGTDLETVGDLLNGDVIGGALGAGYRGVGGAASKLLGSTAGAALGALMASKGLGGIGEVLGPALSESVQNVFSAGNIQSALEQKLGVAPNPNPSVSFQGPTLRDFSLTWTFYPVSEAESDIVFNIIKRLKRASLPVPVFSGRSALLNYPDMCQLNFYPWDFGGSGNNPWGWTEKSIIRIKKCMMSNVTVDYSPSNNPGFFKKDDRPVAIRLTINFSEIEYLLSNDWEGQGGSDTLDTFIERAAFVSSLALNPALALGIAANEVLENTTQ